MTAAALQKDPSLSHSGFRQQAQPVQAVVFDLGGVLTTGLTEALLVLVGRYGQPVPPQEVLAVWSPLYIAATLGRLHPDELWRQFRQKVDLGSLPPGREEAVFLSAVHLREPDAGDTLAGLQQRYTLGLLSNHVARWAYTLLDHFSLRLCFQAVAISSEIGARKPDLRTYQRICQALSIAPERAVYIADEEEDLVGCQAAGMVPIFIPGEDACSRVGLPIARLSDLLLIL